MLRSDCHPLALLNKNHCDRSKRSERKENNEQKREDGENGMIRMLRGHINWKKNNFF